jgi:PPM family protein phosphatase
MSHTVGCTTHVGKVRDANQDSYAVLRRKDLDNALDGVFIVADGMGGTGGKSGGEVASRTVVETLTDGLVEWAYERGSTDKNADLKPLLTEIIERANNRVWMKQIERTELAGMGTTCLVGALREGVLTLGHAGDSRVYLLRDGKLSQLTQDHSSVWQEVLAGNMTREQAATSKHRNSVTKAIGLKQHDVDPDVQTYELEAGDTLLFCTDGLTVEVPDIEIAKILATFPAAQEASDRLVDAALKRGGSDNVTVIVVRYGVFQPLSAASVAEVPVRTSRPAQDDLPTDPNQEWKSKNGGRRSSKSTTPRPEARTENREPASGEPDDDSEERGERRRRSSSRETAGGGSSLLVALTVVLLLACIAEGIALFLAMQNRKVAPVKVPTSAESGKPNMEIVGDETPILYVNPKTIYKQPLREDFLEPDGNDGVIAIDAKGKFIQIDAQGNATALRGALVTPPAPKSDPNWVYTRFDVYGNVYQTYNKGGVGTIRKFDLAGTRRSEDILEGQLLAPKAFVFDSNRNLFVIDGKILKRLETTPDKRKGVELPLSAPGSNAP